MTLSANPQNAIILLLPGKVILVYVHLEKEGAAAATAQHCSWSVTAAAALLPSSLSEMGYFFSSSSSSSSSSPSYNSGWGSECCTGKLAGWLLLWYSWGQFFAGNNHISC
jgi:hypothetical protein